MRREEQSCCAAVLREAAQTKSEVDAFEPGLSRSHEPHAVLDELKNEPYTEEDFKHPEDLGI